MLGHALQRLPGQVEAVELGVALLQLGQYAEGLLVVVEAAVGLHGLLKGVLTCVGEGRMPKIVGESAGLRQVLIEPQGP